MQRSLCSVVLIAALAAGCGDDEQLPPGGGGADAGGGGADAGGLTVPETYDFDSKLVQGESSVSYTGQTLRQVLITDLNAYIGGLTAELDGALEAPADGEVLAVLSFYYQFDDTGAATSLRMATTPPTLQDTYGDISSAKSLAGKMAGNDDVTDHADWDGGDFAGWSDTGIGSPEALLQSWFEELDDLAVARLSSPTLDPDGDPVPSVYITADGRDLQQLIQKFLLMGVTYSQATDDYLDDATDGKGLLTANDAPDGDGAPYTTLEHQWDEGFGYFGAARAYGTMTDADIISPGYLDADSDNAIDLRAEFNFGASTNAAKRDEGSAASAKTDYTAQAMDAFLTGRAIINHAAGRALTTDEMNDLKAQRDLAVDAWERAIAATVVHYINDTLEDMADFDTVDYSFADHAKHWSELKGFALGLQFNPRMQLSAAQFVELHQKIGDAPVLATATEQEIADYEQALLDARDIMKQAYGFAQANVEAW